MESVARSSVTPGLRIAFAIFEDSLRPAGSRDTPVLLSVTVSREERGLNRLGRELGRPALSRPSAAYLRVSQEKGRALRLSGFAFGFSLKLGAMLPDGTALVQDLLVHGLSSPCPFPLLLDCEKPPFAELAGVELFLELVEALAAGPTLNEDFTAWVAWTPSSWEFGPGAMRVRSNMVRNRCMRGNIDELGQATC